MPLPTALKNWISDCKAYAAKHNCSYKQAMSALKKLKKSRKSYHGGGAGAAELNGSSLTEGFAGKEGNAPMKQPVTADGGSADPNAPPPPSPPDHPSPMNQGGGSGMSQFEVGNQDTTQTGGRRRRRRGSKSKRRGQNQNGGKRRKSRRNRRRSSRGGSLSYSQY